MVVVWKLGIGWAWRFQKPEWCRGVLEPLRYPNRDPSFEEVQAEEIDCRTKSTKQVTDKTPVEVMA